jgi:lipopolysaccharide export system protein LptA
MEISLRNLIITATLLLATASSGPAWAVLTGSRLPIELDADSSDIDRRNDRLIFRGVNISQGDLGIEADEAVASTLDFANSEWQFTGKVKIRMSNSSILADKAIMTFSGYRLVLAVIHGQPAQFRQVETDQSITEGQGRLLEYEADNGILRLSDHASLSQSGKQIQGNILTYSINEERVIASSSDATGERVRIIITPDSLEQLSEKTPPLAEQPDVPEEEKNPETPEQP